jgi:HEAT repeat protein
MLSEQLLHPDPLERWEALDQLADLPAQPELLPVIRALLNDDPDPAVRRACPPLLVAWRDTSPAAQAALLQAITHYDTHQSLAVVVEAIVALGLNDDAIVIALAKQIASTEYLVPDLVADALGNLRNPHPDVIEALLWALNISDGYYADDFIRATAAHALGQLGVATDVVLRALQAMVHSFPTQSKEHQAAREALVLLGDRSHVVESGGPDAIS